VSSFRRLRTAVFFFDEASFTLIVRCCERCRRELSGSAAVGEGVGAVVAELSRMTCGTSFVEGGDKTCTTGVFVC
jgi:hypothetical protein